MRKLERSRPNLTVTTRAHGGDFGYGTSSSRIYIVHINMYLSIEQILYFPRKVRIRLRGNTSSNIKYHIQANDHCVTEDGEIYQVVRNSHPSKSLHEQTAKRHRYAPGAEVTQPGEAKKIPEVADQFKRFQMVNFNEHHHCLRATHLKT